MKIFDGSAVASKAKFDRRHGRRVSDPLRVHTFVRSAAAKKGAATTTTVWQVPSRVAVRYGHHRGQNGGCPCSLTLGGLTGPEVHKPHPRDGTR